MKGIDVLIIAAFSIFLAWALIFGLDRQVQIEQAADSQYFKKEMK